MMCRQFAILCAALTFAGCSPPNPEPEQAPGSPASAAAPESASAEVTAAQADAKFSDQLKLAIAAEAAGEAFESEDLAWQAETGMVLVVLELMDGADPNLTADAIGQAGGKVEAVASDRVAARLPLSALRSLAARPEIKLIRAPVYPNRQPAQN